MLPAIRTSLIAANLIVCGGLSVNAKIKVNDYALSSEKVMAAELRQA